MRKALSRSSATSSTPSTFIALGGTERRRLPMQMLKLRPTRAGRRGTGAARETGAGAGTETTDSDEADKMGRPSPPP